MCRLASWRFLAGNRGPCSVDIVCWKGSTLSSLRRVSYFLAHLWEWWCDPGRLIGEIWKRLIFYWSSSLLERSHDVWPSSRLRTGFRVLLRSAVNSDIVNVARTSPVLKIPHDEEIWRCCEICCELGGCSFTSKTVLWLKLADIGTYTSSLDQRKAHASFGISQLMMRPGTKW